MAATESHPAPAAAEAGGRNVPLILKVYGALCLIDGVVTIPMVVLFGAMVAWALSVDPSLITIGTDPTLPVVMTALSVVITLANAFALIVFGISLMRSHRRNAARWSWALIAASVAQLIISIMLQGVGTHLIAPAIQLAILISLSVTVDPTLRHERHMKRVLRDAEDRQAAARGMLGRDPEGRGYLELNFFNLFWVFAVCSVLGLLIEVAYHMLVVDPGVYQDRAGLLFGPFSPIYGFGAVLMTVALNRFYKSSPIIIFVVSAVIGGALRGGGELVHAGGLRRCGLELLRPDDPRTLPRPRRGTHGRAHLDPLHVHVGRARARLDPPLPAPAPRARQPDPLEAPLLAHRSMRRPHARQRRHDARGAGLLVRARLRRAGHLARGGVLRPILR